MDMSGSRRSLLLAIGFLLAGRTLSAAAVPARQTAEIDAAIQLRVNCLHEAPCIADSARNTIAQRLLGKRLFQETRFGHFFMLNSNGDVNAHLSSGEPMVATEVNASGTPPCCWIPCGARR